MNYEEVTITLPRGTRIKGAPINMVVLAHEGEASMPLSEAKSLFYALQRCLGDVDALEQ